MEFLQTTKLGIQIVGDGTAANLAEIIPVTRQQVTWSQSIGILPLPPWHHQTATSGFRYRVTQYLNSIPPALRNFPARAVDNHRTAAQCTETKMTKFRLRRLLREQASLIISPYIPPLNKSIPAYSIPVTHQYSPTIPHHNFPPPGPPITDDNLLPQPPGGSESSQSKPDTAHSPRLDNNAETTDTHQNQVPPNSEGFSPTQTDKDTRTLHLNVPATIPRDNLEY